MPLLSTEKANELHERLCFSQEGRAVYTGARNAAITKEPMLSKGYYHQRGWEARRNWANEQITQFHVFDKAIIIDGKKVSRSEYPD